MRHRLKYLLTSVLFLWLLGLYGHSAPATSPPTTKNVAIVFTTDMQGALEACG